METIEAIQLWYNAQCDGDWEHQYGFTIDTLDNPGWSVHIDIVGTALIARPFDRLKVERSEHDWYFCDVDEGVFKGACGPLNLNELLSIFLAFAANHS